MSNSSKEEIITKLNDGVSKSSLLNSIREDTDSEYSSLARVTRKHIEYLIEKFSIKKDYKLDQNEAKSIEQFVINDQGKTVKLYKPIGVFDTRYPKMDLNDFGLVIMNDRQAEFLKRAMSSPTAILCVDSTHGTNEYNIKLSTLMTVNSFGNGIPCAFFLSTKEDAPNLGYFFQSIKEVTGNLNPKVSSTMYNPLANCF